MGRIKQESLYFNWMKKNSGLVIVCMLISVFLCILTYPGILYTDSYGRVEMALGLKRAIYAFLKGDRGSYAMNSWLTITPSFFILLSIQTVGSIVLYTFIQCFSLFFITCSLGKNMPQRYHRLWNFICITLSPVMWAYGVYYEASVGCAAAMMAMILLIWKWDLIKSGFDKVLSMFLMIFVSYICFGYRANAFTILPAVVTIIVVKEGRKRLRIAALTGSVLVGFMMTSVIPWLLNIDTMSSYAAGFIWEMVSVIQTVEEERPGEYIDYLDDVFGKGETQAAVENSKFKEQDSHINFMWGGNINIEYISAPGIPERILKKYFELIRLEPKAYMQVKGEFISHTLGFGKPLNLYEYDYNRNGFMGTGLYSFNDSWQRQAYVSFFLSYMEHMVLFRMPWVMFLAAFILIMVWRFIFCGGKSQLNLYEAAYGIALCYYGGYVLNTQSFEFRYYFPSWLLLMIIIICLIGDINEERNIIDNRGVQSDSGINSFIFADCVIGKGDR